MPICTIPNIMYLTEISCGSPLCRRHGLQHIHDPSYKKSEKLWTQIYNRLWFLWLSFKHLASQLVLLLEDQLVKKNCNAIEATENISVLFVNWDIKAEAFEAFIVQSFPSPAPLMHAACVKVCKERLLQRVGRNWEQRSKTGHSCSHRPVPWPPLSSRRSRSMHPWRPQGYLAVVKSAELWLLMFSTKWASNLHKAKRKGIPDTLSIRSESMSGLKCTL